MVRLGLGGFVPRDVEDIPRCIEKHVPGRKGYSDRGEVKGILYHMVGVNLYEIEGESMYLYAPYFVATCVFS